MAFDKVPCSVVPINILFVKSLIFDTQSEISFIFTSWNLAAIILLASIVTFCPGINRGCKIFNLFCKL